MNITGYFSQTQNPLTNHLRRNSLETLSKLKHNPSPQHHQPFRKSLTSFQKINLKKNQLPIIKYQNQMDNNIYFNPHSRNNYFKNLIDSYFDKSQLNKSTPNPPNNLKPSYILRKTVLAKKNTFNGLAAQNSQKSKDRSLIISSQTQIQSNKQIYSIMKRQNSVKRTSIKPQTLSRPKANLQKLSSHDQKDQMMQFVQSGSLIAKPIISSQTSLHQNSHLRRITQMNDDEDFDEEQQINSRQQLMSTTFMRSQSNFSRIENKKVLTYENSAVKLYTSWQNEKKYRIKQFKNSIFLKRHHRALECGAYSFWKPYKFNEMSLIIPYVFPLKDYIFKILPHPTSPDYVIIQPKPFYYRMTANHCQELFLLFKQFIKDVQKISKKVLNNKINLSNLFYINGKICIGEWEYSAFKEQNKIQGNHFETRVQPILKCDQEWLVSPEYLAPEILSSISDEKIQFDLWQFQNSSDVYSIGLTFLQIITLVPMWMQQKASIKSRIMKPRDGLLSTPNRSGIRILEKQKLLVSRMSTFLERQVAQEQKNWSFYNILLKMIEPNRAKRITMDQLVKQLL